jgi:2-iminobutanoate/2-iminopropanoate deaminase
VKQKPINATSAPQPAGGYSQAIETRESQRLLFISGQIPETANGEVPQGFRAQAELVWSNICAQLHAADMSVANLVQVTTFLSSREHAALNSEVRQKVLGTYAPAVTIIIAGIFDERWLLEIEAIAAA